MAKENKKLSGGLASLIAGADKPENQTTAEAPATDETTKAEEAPAEEIMEEATPEEEDELLNSIEDERLRAALEERRNRKRGRPRKDAKLRLTQEEEYTRMCTLVKREQLAKLKEICYLETLTLKEILAEVFQNAIDQYEESHGEIVPKVHRGDAASLFARKK